NGNSTSRPHLIEQLRLLSALGGWFDAVLAPTCQVLSNREPLTPRERRGRKEQNGPADGDSSRGGRVFLSVFPGPPVLGIGLRIAGQRCELRLNSRLALAGEKPVNPCPAWRLTSFLKGFAKRGRNNGI